MHSPKENRKRAVSDNVCSLNREPRLNRGKLGKSALRRVPPSALKLAILNAGLRQMDVARATGIHFTALSLIVNGWRMPTAAQTAALCRVLKVGADDLFPSTADRVARASA